MEWACRKIGKTSKQNIWHWEPVLRLVPNAIFMRAADRLKADTLPMPGRVYLAGDWGSDLNWLFQVF